MTRRLMDSYDREESAARDGKWATALILAIGAVCLAVTAAQTADGTGPANASKRSGVQAPRLIPGEETRINRPRIGGEGYVLVYVPEDYTPDRTWPAIFYYHGTSGGPSTSLFQRFTNRKGYVIVAMPYVRPGAESYRSRDRDVRNLKRTIPYLAKHLKLDRHGLLITGVGKGGRYVSVFIGETKELWAGAIIFGAGRSRKARDPGSLKGLPIFIGVGEKDVNGAAARRAASYYKRRGARITVEQWKGLGHSVNENSKLVRRWLLANGPLRGFKATLARAKNLTAAGKPGQAHQLYVRLSKLRPDHQACIDAGKAAQVIAVEARKAMAKAEQLVTDGKYLEAAQSLRRLSAAYRGSPFGRTADGRLAQLRADPQIQTVTKQARLNAAADALEKRAKAAEERKDHAAAVRLYEQYVASCAGADRYVQVKAHLEKLRGDRSVRSALQDKKGQRECVRWLHMADNYASTGNTDKAREYLFKILAKHPDTKWAKQAKMRLAAMPAN